MNILICIIALWGVQIFAGVTEASAQHAASKDSYDGIWAGILSGKDNDTEYWLILKIENGQCHTMLYDNYDGSFEQVEYLRESTMIHGDNMSYVWMSSPDNAIWSETHSYALSYLNPDALSVVMVRQVTNRMADCANPGCNSEWSYALRGRLNRYASFDELRTKLKEYYCALGC